jgi:hypothetical protein
MDGGSHTPPTAPQGTACAGARSVTLLKGAHRWVFTCAPGDEQGLLAGVSEMARRPEVPFDWFDAALVGHQIARRLPSGLNRVDSSVDEVG